jgi:hypothetical protein
MVIGRAITAPEPLDTSNIIPVEKRRWTVEVDAAGT